MNHTHTKKVNINIETSNNELVLRIAKRQTELGGLRICGVGGGVFIFIAAYVQGC